MKGLKLKVGDLVQHFDSALGVIAEIRIKNPLPYVVFWFDKSFYRNHDGRVLTKIAVVREDAP